MADPDAYPIIFRRALAQHLADEGVGLYRPSGPAYTGDERGILPNSSVLPTLFDNAIALGWLQPIADGRANMLYRVQIISRIKGSMVAAENLAALITAAVDHKQGIPAGHNVAWAELFSQLPYTADSSGRCATSQTFHFQGRRPQ